MLAPRSWPSAARRLWTHEWLAAALGFLFFAVVYTRPLALRFMRVSASPDFFQFNWNFWWTRRSLEMLSSPFFTDYQYHPTGTSLALHTTSPHWALLSVPLQYGLPTYAILNLFYILSFWLTGVLTYVLLRRLGVDRGPAFVGGFIFAFSAHRLDRFLCHEIDSLGTMYIPVCMLAVISVYRAVARRDAVPLSLRRQRIWALIIGATVALSALSSWYNGLFVAIFCVLLGLYLTVSEKSFPMASLTIAGAAFALIVGPYLGAMVWAKAAGIYPEVSAGVSRSAAAYNSADLSGFFVPYWHRPAPMFAALEAAGIGQPVTWSRQAWKSYFGNPQEKTVFLGYTATLIAVVWVAIARRYDGGFRLRLTYALAGSAVVFAVLCLGPEARWMGQPLFSVPVYDLMQQVPLLNVARAPSRFVMMVMFCLALLVGFALHGFGRRLSVRSRAVLSFAVLAMAAAETMPQKGKYVAPVTAVVSGFFDRFQAVEDRTEVILNVPVDFYGARGEGGRYLFEQTLHRQHIIGGYLGREPKAVMAFLAQHRLLQALHHNLYGRPKAVHLSDLTDAEIRQELLDLQVDHVVLHAKALSNEAKQEITTRLTAVVGDPTYEDAKVTAFTLRAP